MKKAKEKKSAKPTKNEIAQGQKTMNYVVCAMVVLIILVVIMCALV